MQTGTKVLDKVGDLGEGEVIDTYTNRYCGPEAVEMLTVRFGPDEYADRFPHEVSVISAPVQIH